ncbi:MAG: polysaccharide pyruvyl transferase family protein [Oliverpabstia sp.]|nr:polysaccharide pyruvyl transferase family protein [Oliverpabstia sp.]
MKKIGLLSVYNHNYGSILQAYALQTVLKDAGNEVEIIFYKKNNIFQQAKRLFYIPLLRATVKMKWKSIYCKCFHKKMYDAVLVSREKAFSEFIKNNLHFSKVYEGRNRLIEGTKNYDCFVLGSDQVWNPMNLGGDFYTMTFIPEDKVKITYAPSFGVAKIPEKQKIQTQEYLKRIDYISVRESDGVRIVKELTGRIVKRVVDPTILIDRVVWDNNKGKRIIKDNYIFCYFISANSLYRAFAQRLAQKTGLKLVAIPHVDEFVKADQEFGDFVPESVGPLQFVNLISNASYVCTDSFHGLVFSTLYERPFFTFSRYSGDGADSTNSRLYSYLQLIGMEERMYTAEHEITDKDLNIPDFTMAKVNLEKVRRESAEYLFDALDSVRSSK